MKTINKFTEHDLDQILGVPLLELCENFPTFSPSNLGFSVEKRTVILTKVRRKDETYFYFLGHIGEAIIDNKRARTAEEMVDKLNNSERWYRVATTQEIKFIYMKIMSWCDDILVYEKMN